MSNRYKTAKRTSPADVIVKNALLDITETKNVVRTQLDMKASLISQCLKVAGNMLVQSGDTEARLRLAPGGMMFLSSDLAEYLSDGEPFTAFGTEDDENVQIAYEVIMRVYQDEEDVENDSVSADMQIVRYSDDFENGEILTDDGWVEAEEYDEEYL